MVHSKLFARIGFSVLPLLSACAPPPEAEPGRAASPIIGGTVDSGDPAVVLLASYPDDHSELLTCTAVLIAPTVLLTAAHCVDTANHPGHTFGVFTGPDASAYDDVDSLAPKLLAVAEVHAHPDYNPDPPFHADVGVVVLAAPVDIAPLPVQRDALTPSIVGEAARIIGYGQTVYGKYNAVKNEATTVVAGLPAKDTVLVGDAQKRSCVGDSGGPALVKMAGVETLIGVDSYTDTNGCLEAAHYQRTDLYLDFIDVYAPPPEGSGGSGGSGGSPTAGVGGSSAGSGGDGGSAGAGGDGGDGGSDTSSGGGCALAKGNAGETPSPAWLVLPLALVAGLRRRRQRGH